MVPSSTPTHMLSYKSPIKPVKKNQIPFHLRRDYVFFGYNNDSNRLGIEWFIREVIPHISRKFKLHIAGSVNVAGICFCQPSQNPPCLSNHTSVVCHGTLSDDKLNELVASSRVAINPALEPSGIATKTCRAMALGTPVVVTDHDGTFDRNRTSVGGKRCVQGDTDVLCFAEELNYLLSDEEIWNSASEAAPLFVEAHFGSSQYEEDWSDIIHSASTRNVSIVIMGNAKANGESLASQNWHITKMLSEVPGVHVSVLADDFSPTIPGVYHFVSQYDEMAVRADIVIQQSWPPSFMTLPERFCGHGCRVVKILPWEFGYLPEEWVSLLQNTTDFLWAPSEYNRRGFSRSGISPLRSTVVHPGIDCDELDRVDSPNEVKNENDSITFIFSGAFLPRKGVDIILEEWENTFCTGSEEPTTQSLPSTKLILHTTYELGFNGTEVANMIRITKKCTNIDWLRGVFLERGPYLDMLKSGDVYLAPYRSEGFGLPIVEALRLGLSVVVSAGESASIDYVSFSPNDPTFHRVFPVGVEEIKCEHFPCQKEDLCVFSDGCKRLVNAPMWFDVDRVELRDQMKRAYSEVVRSRNRVWNEVQFRMAPVSSFCWSILEKEYMIHISNLLESPIQRTMPQLKRPALKCESDIRWLGVLVSCIWIFPHHRLALSMCPHRYHRY